MLLNVYMVKFVLLITLNLLKIYRSSLYASYALIMEQKIVLYVLFIHLYVATTLMNLLVKRALIWKVKLQSGLHFYINVIGPF